MSSQVKSYNFILTTHVRERYVERFSRESIDFIHLRRCRTSECEECHDLTYRLREMAERFRNRWDKIICAKLHDAEDVKIFHNNSIFMDYMYNHYGFQRYRFLVEGQIVFVVIEDEGKQIVKTCMDVNRPVNGSSIIGDFINRPRFNRLKRQYAN